MVESVDFNIAGHDEELCKKTITYDKKNLKVLCHKHGGLLPAQQLRLEDSIGTSWTGISHLQAAWKNVVERYGRCGSGTVVCVPMVGLHGATHLGVSMALQARAFAGFN